MSVERLVEKMITFDKTAKSVTFEAAIPGAKKVGTDVVGVLTLTAPLNPRTGENAMFAMTCTEKQAQALRDWFEDLFRTAGDDIANRYGLTYRAPSGEKSDASALVPADRILGPLRYSLPHG